MLRRNVTRVRFAERFRAIIDEYNAGGSQNDDFYEKLLKLIEELREEEKRVKLTAKELYHTLIQKRKELFVVGWQNDPQPKERVRGEIVTVLNRFLPESYDV